MSNKFILNTGYCRTHDVVIINMNTRAKKVNGDYEFSDAEKQFVHMEQVVTSVTILTPDPIDIRKFDAIDLDKKLIQQITQEIQRLESVELLPEPIEY